MPSSWMRWMEWLEMSTGEECRYKNLKFVPPEITKVALCNLMINQVYM